jgi:hypothetical protein
MHCFIFRIYLVFSLFVSDLFRVLIDICCIQKFNNTGVEIILEAVGGQCQATYPQTIQYCLVGGLEHVLFFHRLGMSSSRLTNSYFSKGLFYHQSVVWVVYPFGDVIADLRHFNLVLFAWWFGIRSADIDDRLLLGTPFTTDLDGDMRIDTYLFLAPYCGWTSYTPSLSFTLYQGLDPYLHSCDISGFMPTDCCFSSPRFWSLITRLSLSTPSGHGMASGR